jgi:4-carboxymuconolactone decarboxylase
MKQSKRHQTGLEQFKAIDSEAVEKIIDELKDVSPELGNYIIEYAYGDIYSRKELDLKSKEIAIIAALTALGNAQPQLKFHINAGLNIGLTEIEIKEIILLMSVYAGFPAALNGTAILKEVIKARNLNKNKQ